LTVHLKVKVAPAGGEAGAVNLSLSAATGGAPLQNPPSYSRFPNLCSLGNWQTFEKCTVSKVPIARYFVFVGSLLLAVLFIADWLLPMSRTPTATGGEAEKPIIAVKAEALPAGW